MDSGPEMRAGGTMIESMIQTYGYLTVLVGTFLEGETILVLGGFAAHRGYLSLRWVILTAFVGSLCGDQLFFFLGRWHSEKVLARRPAWKARIARAERLLDQHSTGLILVFRFLYGLRTVAPFVMGMSPVRSLKFFLLNALGAMTWAIAVGTGGYLFGQALEIMIGNVKHYELRAFGVIALAGVVVWAVYLFCRRKKRLFGAKGPLRMP